MLSQLSSTIVESPKFAVLLNAKAKRWTGDLHEQILRWVPSKDLFLTDDFAQAERTVDTLVQSDYDVVFTGGGDGTIMYLVNAIEQRVRNGLVKAEDAPPVGVLRMGTGNAVATYLECRPIVEDLRALANGAPMVIYDVPMVAGEDDVATPFAGFGWDALILNDYDAFKDSARQTPFENYATGLGGYAVSIASRTVRNAMKLGKFQVKVTTNADATEIDQKGNVLREFEAGEVILNRPVVITSVGTIPFWGFSIRMFPHVTSQEGRVHYRAYWGSVANVVSRLDRFWKGQFNDDVIADFLVSDITLTLENPIPYQVSGDPQGYEREVRWSITDRPARLAVPLR